MILETRASCFDTSIDTHNRLTIKPYGLRNRNLKPKHLEHFPVLRVVFINTQGL
jgi:hypothetical protein